LLSRCYHINTVMKNTNYTMIRIHKERLVELGILSKEYGLSRTQILDQLVQTAFQNMLGEVANHDTVA